MTKEKLLNILEDAIGQMEKIVDQGPPETKVKAAKALSELITLYKEISTPIPGSPELHSVKSDAKPI